MPIEKKQNSNNQRSTHTSKNWMRYDILRSLRRKALAILAGIAILLSLFGLLVDARQPQPPVFVSVSVKTLLEEHLRSIASSDTSPALIQQETIKYLNAIDTVVQDLSHQGDVIVLISEAVMGSGVPDFTDDVRERVKLRLGANTINLPKNPQITQRTIGDDPQDSSLGQSQ